MSGLVTDDERVAIADVILVLAGIAQGVDIFLLPTNSWIFRVWDSSKALLWVPLLEILSFPN